MKIIESLQDSGLSTKHVTETVENEVQEQKGGFLGMLRATLSVTLKMYQKSCIKSRQGNG